MPSIFHGGVLNTPGGIPSDTRLALTDDGRLQADGRQRYANVFARAWDCITRSPEKVEANKELARRCVAEIRAKYGDGIADMASRELKSQLTLGRPLTAYRIGYVLRNAIDSANTAWLRDQGLTRREIRGAEMQFSRTELSLLREAGLSIEIGRQYKDRQIPIHPRTLVAHCRDENVVEGSKVPLRGGAVSTPYSVQYRRGDQLDDVVFKEARLGEGHGDAALALGIAKNSCMAVRNVATKAVDQLLGFNLTPDTRIGMLDGQLGMVMGFAEGVPAMKQREVDVTEEMTAQVQAWREMVDQEILDPEGFKDMLQASNLRIDGERILRTEEVGVQQNYADPGLRRELVKLQLLDALTAQGDRHGGNYLIRRDETGRFTGLSAIDNDQAFGTAIKNPDELHNGILGLRGVKLPPVVDEGMKAAFENLSDAQLREVLTGLLPEAEIAAAITRLHVIQDYLAGGPPPVVLGIDDPDAWGAEEVGLALHDPTTSYVGRDLDVLARIGTVVSYEEAQ